MRKKQWLEFLIYLMATIVATILIANVGKAPIGPNGSQVGFAAINGFFHELFGIHVIWYQITEIFGVFAILVMGCFALLGLVQLIRGKSFKKVDKELYALADVYAILLGLYVLFEKLVINYRPIIMPGETEVEASFPSSHTMLICTVCLTTMVATKRLFADAKMASLQKLIDVVCALVIGLTIFGRLYCGVHWFTDILAGLLYATTLEKLYVALISEK